MPDDILKTAVIGLGRIAWSDHLPILKSNPHYKIAAVVDPVRERGNEALAQFGAERWYDSVESMLAEMSPDLGVVCSPTIFHARQSIALLDHGAHVFCDKPAACDLDETRAMFAAAEKAGRKLMVFQPRRMVPNSFSIREIIRSGKLGKLYQMKLFIGNYVRRNDWQAFRKNGGGMLRNYGAHYIDQMIYLTGEKLEVLSCRTARIASAGDADDVVKILLRGKASGILLDIDINQASAHNPYVWLLYGTSGAAWLPKYGENWMLRYFDPAELAPVQCVEKMAASDRKYPEDSIPFRTEEYRPAEFPSPAQIHYDNLYEWIRGKTSPLVPAADTLELMSLLEDCKKLAEHP